MLGACRINFGFWWILEFSKVSLNVKLVFFLIFDKRETIKFEWFIFPTRKNDQFVFCLSSNDIKACITETSLPVISTSCKETMIQSILRFYISGLGLSLVGHCSPIVSSTNASLYYDPFQSNSEYLKAWNQRANWYEIS